MQKPSHDDRGFKASLRSALQRLSPALWQAVAACIDLVAGRYETALAKAEAKHQAALRRIENLEKAMGEQHRVEQVRTFMDWIDHAPLPESFLVSIVLPTRDRRDLLERAIASVSAQTYGKWELLIVDDGSVDKTPDFLASLSDPRVCSYRSEGRGACAARNVALAHLAGEIVTYLDDDNLMHPNWLKSVVWAFSQRPETSVLYGAFLVDDFARVDPRNKGELPRLFFWPYNHLAVAVDNIADAGCMAHRAGLPEAQFDESLREMGDWDLFLRLTRQTPPFALPAIACYYTTDAPNRLSYGPTHDADLQRVREKNRR